MVTTTIAAGELVNLSLSSFSIGAASLYTAKLRNTMQDFIWGGEAAWGGGGHLHLCYPPPPPPPPPFMNYYIMYARLAIAHAPTLYFTILQFLEQLITNSCMPSWTI